MVGPMFLEQNACLATDEQCTKNRTMADRVQVYLFFGNVAYLYRCSFLYRKLIHVYMCFVILDKTLPKFHFVIGGIPPPFIKFQPN